MAQSQGDLNFKIGGARGEPTRIQATLPPEDDIAAFLHFLRPFVLTKSATSFARMRSLLARRITLPPVQQHLKRLKSIYAGNEIPFEIEIGSPNGKLVLNSEDAMNKWLNGLEYHQDDDKRDAVLSTFTVFTAPATRAMLLYCLLQRSSAIGKLGAIIDRLAKREGRAIRTA